MSVRSDIELLRKVPLFADIEPVQLQVLVFSAERIEVAAHEALFTAGAQVGARAAGDPGSGQAIIAWLDMVGCPNVRRAMEAAKRCYQPTLAWVFADRESFRTCGAASISSRDMDRDRTVTMVRRAP